MNKNHAEWDYEIHSIKTCPTLLEKIGAINWLMVILKEKSTLFYWQDRAGTEEGVKLRNMQTHRLSHICNRVDEIIDHISKQITRGVTSYADTTRHLNSYDGILAKTGGQGQARNFMDTNCRMFQCQREIKQTVISQTIQIKYQSIIDRICCQLTKYTISVLFTRKNSRIKEEPCIYSTQFSKKYSSYGK